MRAHKVPPEERTRWDRSWSSLHQGQVLRHKDRNRTFDANAPTISQSSPSLAHVAFYSNIEHEVLRVTSHPRVQPLLDTVWDESRNAHSVYHPRSQRFRIALHCQRSTQKPSQRWGLGFWTRSPLFGHVRDPDMSVTTSLSVGAQYTSASTGIPHPGGCIWYEWGIESGYSSVMRQR